MVTKRPLTDGPATITTKGWALLNDRFTYLPPEVVELALILDTHFRKGMTVQRTFANVPDLLTVRPSTELDLGRAGTPAEAVAKELLKSVAWINPVRSVADAPYVGLGEFQTAAYYRGWCLYRESAHEYVALRAPAMHLLQQFLNDWCFVGTTRRPGMPGAIPKLRARLRPDAPLRPTKNAATDLPVRDGDSSTGNQ